MVKKGQKRKKFQARFGGKKRRRLIGNRRRRLRFKRRVKSIAMNAGELKKEQIDHHTTPLAISSSGVTDEMTVIPVGDNNQQRDGNRVMAKWLNITGYFTCEAVANFNKIQIIVTVASCGESVPNSSLPIWGMNRRYYITDPTEKFKIVYRKDFVLTPKPMATLSLLAPVKFNKTIPLNKMLVWKDSTSTNCIRNRVQVHFISDSTVIPHPDFTGFVTLGFKDF